MVTKKIKISLLFLLFLIALFFSLSFTSPGSTSGWELVYENTSTGEEFSGDIDELILAVMDGNDIKVILHFNSENLHYQMNLSKVKVDLKEKTVTGYNYDFRANPTDSNVYERISTYSTNGEYTSVYKENPFYRNPEIIRVSMSWYVRN